MSDKRIGNEAIHVLNDKYQFVSAQQSTNAKWLDLDNVVSVKRDKTIYAVRARTTFDFENQDDNVEFFCNLNGDSGLGLQLNLNPNLPRGNLLSSAVFRGFTANTGHIFEGTSDLPVYGNINSSLLSGNVGWAGSLEGDKPFSNVIGASGNINVSSNISVYSNVGVRNESGLTKTQLGGWLYIDGNLKSVKDTPTAGDLHVNIGNSYSSKTLFMSNMTTNTVRWNRLINANITGNVICTSSTDPCDFRGNAIPYQADHLNNTSNIGIYSNAATNEPYRFQFALRRNNETVSNENPIYLGRISRFGTRLTDIVGTMSKVLSLDSFSGNFFANLPSDNEIYYNSVKTPTEFSITGNYKSTDVFPFNGNYTDSNIGNLNGNLFLAGNAFHDFVKLGKYDSLFNDYIAGANLTIEAGDSFKQNDRFTVVQSNLNMTNAWYLYDRLNITSEKYKKPSEIFAPSDSAGAIVTEVSDPVTQTIDVNPDKYLSKASMKSNGVDTLDSKVAHLSFYNIIANNWQATQEIQPATLKTPDLINTPNMNEYTSGNTIQLYLRRGSIAIDNFSDISGTVSTTSSKYFNTLPSYLKSYKEPEGGIYIEDKTVCQTNSANLAVDASSQISIDVSDTLTINANITPDLCFYVYANADINNRVDRRGNVVIPVTNDTILANVWTYSNLNVVKTSSVTFDPKIAYNTFDGLTVDNPYAKKNLIYTVKFGKVLGETNLSSETASQTQYGFYANLTKSGNVLSSTIANLNQMSSDTNLTNNNHMNGLLLNGVAYSEYEFTNFSYKFTDLGNIMQINDSNYKYSSVLPVVGNLVTGATASQILNSVKDNYMNILVDYTGTSIAGNDNDIHRLAIYDNQYRYYVSSVKKTGGAPVDNNTLYRNGAGNAENEDVFTIMPTLGTITSAPSTSNAGAQGITLGSFLLYTYEKVYDNSSMDSFYPFVTPNKPWTDRVADKTDNDNYLFPGFIYKYSNATAELHNYRDETNCDFVISNNVKDIEQSISLIIFSSDITTKTLKLGLSTDTNTKSVNVKPIRLGGSSNTTRQWYTPVTLKIQGEANSYVVLLIRIAVDPTTAVFTGLDSSYDAYTPVSVNINSIEKSSDNFNQIMFKSKLQVYKNDNSLDTTNYTNIVNNHKTKLSNFNYSSEFGASNTNVSVNLYSVPTNNLVVFYAYTKNTIKKLMNYTQTDYELDNSVNYDTASEAAKYKKINRPISSLNFATSKENNSSTSAVDGVNYNPPIPPNSTRFYLDSGYGEDIYVDYLNSSTVSLKNMMKLQLSRSLEWIVTRQEVGSSVIETIGRGLLTKNPNGTVGATKDYLLSENLGKAKSGFFMNVKTNIIDLASHILAQKRQTGGLKMNSTPQFILNTKSDSISVSLFHENPSTLAKTYISNKSSETNYVSLSKLFAADPGINQKVSTLPEFEFDLVRSLSNTNVNIQNPSDALFRVRIRLDNYCVVHAKKSVNGSNVVFSSLTNVNTTSLNVNMFSDLKRTLNYDFLNITSPSVFGNDFKLIKSFKHLGFGKADLRVYEFTSHYENELPTQELKTTGGTRVNGAHPSFNFPTSSAYNFVPVAPSSVSAVTKEIEYDNTKNRFFVNLGNTDFPDRVYFRGTQLSSQPTKINDTETFLLYTGLRPIGFLTYERTGANTTFSAFKLGEPATFLNASLLFTDNPKQGAAFTSLLAAGNPNNLPQPTTYKLFYSIAFTNRNTAKAIQVRGATYTFKQDDIFKVAGACPNLFGVARSLSDLLSDLKLGVTSAGTTAYYSLNSSYKGNRYLTTDQEKYSDTYLTYGINSPTDGYLFNLKIFGSVSTTGIFRFKIEPSQMMIYQAMDVNENGEIDSSYATISDNNVSGLNNQSQVSTISNAFNLNNNFSELLYNLKSNPTNNLVYRQPTVIQTIDLNGGWNAVSGSGLDIKLNKKWAVGYNLDCFFVFRNNNISTFDVISIDTDRQNASASVASLKVQNSLPMVIGSKNSWARSKGYSDDSNYHSGLTFKVRSDVKIKQGDIVRLFVDNTPSANTLSVNATVAGKAAKLYKLSDYDNENYSRLLDKQVKLENKFA